MRWLRRRASKPHPRSPERAAKQGPTSAAYEFGGDLWRPWDTVKAIDTVQLLALEIASREAGMLEGVEGWLRPRVAPNGRHLIQPAMIAAPVLASCRVLFEMVNGVGALGRIQLPLEIFNALPDSLDSREKEAGMELMLSGDTLSLPDWVDRYDIE